MRKQMKPFWLAASVVLIAGISPAMADNINKKTEFTFSQPVEVPGRVLTPGKYVFELANDSTDRDIVEIYSEDDSGRLKLLTTLFAIPEYRLRTENTASIQFEERPKGTPEAIQSWYYPGESTGWEFMYPATGTARPHQS